METKGLRFTDAFMDVSYVTDDAFRLFICPLAKPPILSIPYITFLSFSIIST